MRRREFITLLGGTAAWPLAAQAQQPVRVKRIGLMGNLQLRPIESFQNRLRELGYIEGQNLIVEYRFAEGREERYSGFAAELVALPVDLIVTWGTPAAFAAKHATTTIPIVLGALGTSSIPGLSQILPALAQTSQASSHSTSSSSRNASSCSRRWFPASHGWRCSETAQIRSIASIWKRLTARPKNFQ